MDRVIKSTVAITLAFIMLFSMIPIPFVGADECSSCSLENQENMGDSENPSCPWNFQENILASEENKAVEIALTAVREYSLTCENCPEINENCYMVRVKGETAVVVFILKNLPQTIDDDLIGIAVSVDMCENSTTVWSVYISPFKIQFVSEYGSVVMTYDPPMEEWHITIEPVRSDPVAYEILTDMASALNFWCEFICGIACGLACAVGVSACCAFLPWACAACGLGCAVGCNELCESICGGEPPPPPPPLLVPEIWAWTAMAKLGERVDVWWRLTNSSDDYLQNVSVQSYIFLGSTCYNVCGWDSNLTYIDLGPSETKELHQTVKTRTDLSPSNDTQWRARARYEGVNYDDTAPITLLPSSLVSRVVEAPGKVSLGETFTVRWRVTNDYPCRIENVKVHSYVYLYKFETDETICYTVEGWNANAQYIDLEPGENRELVQTITIRSDVEPTTETRLRVRAVVPPQKANENLEEGEPIYESVAFYDTRSINVVPPPDSGVIWIFPSDDATVAESYPDSPETRTDRVGIRSWDASVGDIEDYRNIRSLLKFDLSKIPEGATITDAELRLYCYYAGYTITGVTDVHVLPARDDWTEDTVTWNNPPWSGNVPDDTLDVWVPPEYVDKYGWPRVWVPWTVTSFVVDEFEGDVTASFCLRAATESYDSQWRNVYFRSKDYTYGATKIGGYDPHLVVTYVPPQ